MYAPLYSPAFGFFLFAFTSRTMPTTNIIAPTPDIKSLIFAKTIIAPRRINATGIYFFRSFFILFSLLNCGIKQPLDQIIFAVERFFVSGDLRFKVLDLLFKSGFSVCIDDFFLSV